MGRTGELQMKLGDTLIIKTTGEQVAYLKPTGNENEVYVRRPTMTENGIKHEIIEMFNYELSTLEDHLTHELVTHKLKQKLQKELLKEEDDNQPGPAAPISMLN